MSPDPASTADLDQALANLTDRELAQFVHRMSVYARTFIDGGEPRIADVFAAVTVLAAEQQDHRRALAEHARTQLDGDDIGGLVDDQ